MYQYQIIGVVIVILCILLLMIYFIIEVHEKKIVASLMQHIHSSNATKISTNQLILEHSIEEESNDLKTVCDNINNKEEKHHDIVLSKNINVNYDMATNTLVVDTTALLNFLLLVAMTKVKTVQERSIVYSAIISMVHWMYTHIVKEK